MMEIEPIPGPFGVSVSGIDLSGDLDDAVITKLIDLLHRHQILVVEGQSLSHAAYVRLGCQWGRPVVQPSTYDIDKDFPEVVRLANPPTLSERYRDGAIHWHSDGTYEEVPASV